MIEKIKQLVHIEAWRDFYDQEWRLKVMFMNWELARFRFQNADFNLTIDEKSGAYSIQRLKKGEH